LEKVIQKTNKIKACSFSLLINEEERKKKTKQSLLFHPLTLFLVFKN